MPEPNNAALSVPFTQSMVMEIAMDWDDPYKIALKYGISAEDFDELRLYEPYVKAVAEAKRLNDEHGVTAELKAKMSVEDLIPTMHRMVKDAELPSQVRVAAFDKLAQLAKFRETSTNGNAAAGPMVSIIFNDAPTAENIQLEATPAPIIDVESI